MMTYGASASYVREVLPGFTPFVVAGAGAKRYDIDVADVSAQTDFMWNFGAGALYALRPGLSLYLEARDFVSTFKSNMSVEDGAQHDLVLAAGLRLTRPRGVVTVARR